MEQHRLVDLSSEHSSTRFFACPCGKIYKSYPALFTHIRNKHEGKAPGQLILPDSDSRKSIQSCKTDSKSTLQSQKSIRSSSYIPNQPLEDSHSNGSQKEPTKDQCIKKIAVIMNDLPPKEISKRYLNEMSAVTQMNVYLSTRQNRTPNGCIGYILAEFLEELSKLLEWSKFKHCFTMLMAYVELILRKVKQNSTVENIPVDVLCEYVNQFVERGAQDISIDYDLNDLDVFKKETILATFLWLFRWMLQRGYISYKIGLNPVRYPQRELLE